MGGTPFDAVLGKFHAPTHARAGHALERLRHGSRHLERDLLLLARLWWSASGCLGGVRWLAEPTREGIMLVAKTIVTSHDDGAVSAGIKALYSASRICGFGTFEDLPPSLWEIDGTLGAINAVLDRERPLQRIAATKHAMILPHVAFAPALRRRLDDAVYTVRWLAVMALAKLDTDATVLVSALEASPPRALWKDYYWFWDAIEALGPAGLPLLERYPRPTKWKEEK